MQCNSEKFQPGQIEFLTENREGINETLETLMKLHMYNFIGSHHFITILAFQKRKEKLVYSNN